MADDLHDPDVPAAGHPCTDDAGEISGPSAFARLLRDVAKLDAIAPPLGPGDRIAHFEIVSELGRGGMGVVYLADDLSLRRQVALKVLPAAFAHDEDRRRRLLREARAIAAVTHPNIASVHEVGEWQGRIYVAMERVVGETLRTRMLSASRLPIDEVLETVAGILRGVGAAHAAGLIHRDLKPDNVVVGAGGGVKILDFGLARRASDRATPDEAAETSLVTQEGVVLGTPAYMSPEQAAGGDVDARSDLFSVGVMLYEMLAGKRPFVGSTPVAVIAALFGKDAEPPERLRPEIAPALSVVVRRCLAKDPAERYQDAASLAAALDEARSSSLELAPAAAPVPRSARAAWSAGRVVAAVAGAALVLVAALGARRVIDERRSGKAPAAAAAPAESWVLACPPFRAVGIEEPSGWLGAIAAGTFCARARILLGGSPERTLVPAELLGLPATLASDYPEEPYDAPDARERALAAARRASAYVDGEVRDLGTDFEVTLSLRSRDGRELGTGRGRSPAVYAAVREAMEPLLSSGGLPTAQLDPEIGRWIAAADTEAALALLDMQFAESLNAGTYDAECAKVARLPGDVVQVQRDFWRSNCATVRGRPEPDIQTSPPSSTDPARFAQEAYAFHILGVGGDGPAIARALQERARLERGGWGRATLSALESCFWQASDMENARAAALRAVELAPENPDPYLCSPWGMLATVASEGRGTSSAIAGFRSWHTWAAPIWAVLASDPSKALRDAARAYRVAPENAIVAARLFDRFLKAGDRDRARAIALRMRGHEAPVLALEAEILLVRLDASETRFAAALERAKAALADTSRHGYARAQQADLAWHAFEIAEILGRGRDVAELLARNLVLVDPPVLARNDPFLARSAALCVAAGSGIGARCVARVRSLVRSGYLRDPFGDTEAILTAAERLAADDAEGAAAVLRPMLATGTPSHPALAWLMVTAFDRTGARDLADRVDAAALAEPGGYAGVNLAHVRTARRHAKGDPARARELASKVVAAWSLADTTPPALAELQAIVKRR